MPSTFPTTLDTLGTGFVGASSMVGVHAQHHDDLADAVNKLERSVGQVFGIKNTAFAGGAVGDGATDDTAAIQAALNAAAATTPGPAVVTIPVGTFKITSALSVPPGVSIIGAGLFSIIQANNCDGLSFQVSNYTGAIRISDFQIQGVSASGNFAAVRVAGNLLGDGVASSRVTGVTFDSLHIFNFGYAFRLRGLWRSAIRRVTALNVYYGVYCVGQNILVVYEDCNFEKNVPPGTPSGATNSVGFLCDSAFDYNPSGNTEKPPENVRVHHCQFYGFDYGIYHLRALLAQYASCDVDASLVAGIRFFSAGGGLRITDNYVNVTGSGGLYGIRGEAVGTASDTAIELANNYLIASSPNAAAVGIQLDDKQCNTVIRNNTLTGFKVADIQAGSNNTGIKVVDNQCRSVDPTNSIIFASTSSGMIDRNYVNTVPSVGSKLIVTATRMFGPGAATYDPWTNATLTNSWGDTGAPYGATGYFKDANNVVHLRGIVAGGTANTSIFTLPAGLRPPLKVSMSQRYFTGSVQGMSETTINTDGTVVLASSSTSFHYLEGINFRAAGAT